MFFLKEKKCLSKKEQRKLERKKTSPTKATENWKNHRIRIGLTKNSKEYHNKKKIIEKVSTKKNCPQSHVVQNLNTVFGVVVIRQDFRRKKKS